MKKITLIALSLSLCFTSVNAQKVGTFWGLTSQGGDSVNGGVLFNFNANTKTETVARSFANGPTGPQYGNLIKASDGLLYGMTPAGCYANGGGAIFRCDTSGNNMTILYAFKGGSDGGGPYGSLIQANDGNLYGMTNYGGNSGSGVIFKCTTSGTETAIYSFTNNEKPYGSLIQATDGNLYGMTHGGGSNGMGSIFQCSLSGTYNLLVSFTGASGPAMGANPYGGLVQATNGLLYGMTYSGGANNVGVIFQCTTTGTYTDLVDLTSANSNPYGSLIQANDGNLYGMTFAGGVNSDGTVFQCTTGGALTTLISFTGQPGPFEGASPEGSLIQASDGNLWGLTYSGNENNNGVLFSCPLTGGTENMYAINNSTFPMGSLVQGTTTKLYAMSSQGGLANAGTIFDFDMTQSTVSTIFSFGTNYSGTSPNGGLIQGTDGAFYGMTNKGGAYGYGTVFKYNNGTYTILHDFSDSSFNGASPNGKLILSHTGVLYGLTSSGGIYGTAGTLFSLNEDGTGFRIVTSLGGAYGNGPYGSPLLANDNRFYGMTSAGGTGGSGQILSFDSLGNVTQIYNFSGGTDGAIPYGSLIQSPTGAFYGMTESGGYNGLGVIFRDSSYAYTVLHSFSGSDGSRPYGDLLLAKDGYLYGMTSQGGANGFGTIFKCSVSGSFYSVIYNFTNMEYPEGTLIQGSDGNLYGMANQGGAGNNGYIFKCSTTGSFTDLSDFNGSDGTAPVYGALLEQLGVSIQNQPTCDGTNYTLNAAAVGGSQPYSYLWSTGATTSSINESTPITVWVRVMDSKSISAYDTITMQAYTPVSVSPSSIGPSCFGGNDGALNSSVYNGIPPYTYSWSNGATTSQVTNVSAGTYTLTVTDSVGCSQSNSIPVNQPPAIRDSITNVTNVSCWGGNNGSATISFTGGTGTINFQWNDPSYQTTPTAIGLYSGTYSCSITDANGCSPAINPTVTIYQPSQLTASTGGSTTVCQGNAASIIANANGGTYPYTFTWTPGNLNGNTQQVLPLSTTNYNVVIVDQNGCSLTTNETVVVNIPPDLTIKGSSGTSICAGSTDTLTATALGTSPFTFTWSSGNTGDSTVVTSAGTYSVYVNDANGCSSNLSTYITVNNLPTIAISGVTTICSGSSTTLTGIGANSYSWSGGPATAAYTVSPVNTTTYTVTGTSAQGCSNTATATVTVSSPNAIAANVFPGTSVCSGSNVVLYGSGGTAYSWSGGVSDGVSFHPTATTTYTVTSESNGCTSKDSITVTVNTLPTVGITTTPKDTICEGGSVTLTASGGVSYSWTNGVTNGIAFSPTTSDVYGVTVTDANGCENTAQQAVVVDALPSVTGSVNPQTVCQGSSVTLSGNGATSYSWSGGVTNGVPFVPAGTGSYTVTGTDAHGCSNTAIIGITVNAIPVLSDSAIPSTSVCQGNPVALVGKGASSYSWSGGVINGISFVPTVSGTYTVTGYGANGCTAKDSISIKVNNKVIVTPLAINTTCGTNNGDIKVNASSGTAPYTYSWSTTPVNTTDSIGNLSPGTYIITVSDANKCSSYASIDIASSTSPILSISSSSSSCGNASGQASVGVVGGTPPYRYNWSNGDTTSYANNLTIGTYIVTVSDLNHCSSFASAEISNVNGPSISTNAVTNINCNGQSTGAINISVSGGTGPYTYAWSDGETTQNISGLSAGPYQLTVSDANGCSALGNYTITQPTALVMSKTTTKANCGVADGSASVNVNGGTPPYSYLWSNGRTNDSIKNVVAGIYHITIADHNGCAIDSAQVSISNVNAPVPSIAVSGSTSCNGGGVTLTANVSGGTMPYSYMWSTGSTTTAISHIPAGSYNIAVTDHLGCIGVADTTIQETPPPVAPLCMVTVDSATQKNLVIWNKYQSSGIASYNLYRETTQAGVYQKIANIPYNNLSTYLDPVADPTVRSWRYKLTEVDSCGNESQQSPDNKTMHLTVNKGLGGTVNLIWDNYEGMTFYTYYVYRDTSLTTLTKIDSIPNNIFTYTDAKPPQALNLYYRIQVVNPNPCLPSGLRPQAVNYNASKSNSGNIAYNAVGIAPVSEQTGKLTVYPNPSTGIFSFTLTESKGSKNLKLSIVNELGQVIATNEYNDTPSTFTKQLDLSSLAKGVYFLKLQSDNDTQYNKIVIQ